uniref:non-specific serine/threonine protein kinase n=1 Tax=Strigamia maritima TaxID=126957 RepID=T1J744_STRMM
MGGFGLVLDLKSDAQHDASEGDAKYVSAEAMMGYFTKAANIFSLGITILEMACDLDLRDKDVWQDLRRGRLPHNLMTHISPELTAVIQSMMLEEYLKRPTADDLLALPRVVDVWHKRKRIYATANAIKLPT